MKGACTKRGLPAHGARFTLAANFSPRPPGEAVAHEFLTDDQRRGKKRPTAPLARAIKTATPSSEKTNVFPRQVAGPCFSPAPPGK
jgi:hypothetical protein